MVLSKVPHILWSLAGFFCALGVFEQQAGNPHCVEDGHLSQRGDAGARGGAGVFCELAIAFPQFTQNTIKAADGFGTKLLEAVAGAAGNPAKSGSAGAQQRTSPHSTARCG